VFNLEWYTVDHWRVCRSRQWCLDLFDSLRGTDTPKDLFQIDVGFQIVGVFHQSVADVQAAVPAAGQLRRSFAV
jgi:hypothetical protein